MKRRALHVFGALGVGGAETWIEQVVAAREPDDWEFDFCLLAAHEGPLAAKLRERGCRILRCPLEPPATFPWRFHNLLKQNKFDVVHSHVLLFSGIVLAVADTPVRIAHAHNSHDGRADSIGREAYRRGMRGLISRHSTTVLGCSTEAARFLTPKRAEILPYGIDLKRFLNCNYLKTMRLELAWGPGTRVIGAVGRLCEQKNHAFLIEAFALAVKQRPELRLAIVGEGPLRAELEQQIQRLRLGGRVRLMGLRGDVPELMLGLFDAFAMPSHHEGLPLALLEAQAAGLPSIGSEFGVIRGGLDQLFTLTMAVSDPQKWVSGLIEAVDARRTPVEAACSKMAAGGFGIEGSWRRLTAIYEARAASEAAA